MITVSQAEMQRAAAVYRRLVAGTLTLTAPQRVRLETYVNTRLLQARHGTLTLAPEVTLTRDAAVGMWLKLWLMVRTLSCRDEGTRQDRGTTHPHPLEEVTG